MRMRAACLCEERVEISGGPGTGIEAAVYPHPYPTGLQIACRVPCRVCHVMATPCRHKGDCAVSTQGRLYYVGQIGGETHTPAMVPTSLMTTRA